MSENVLSYGDCKKTYSFGGVKSTVTVYEADGFTVELAFPRPFLLVGKCGGCARIDLGGGAMSSSLTFGANDVDDVPPRLHFSPKVQWVHIALQEMDVAGKEYGGVFMYGGDMRGTYDGMLCAPMYLYIENVAPGIWMDDSSIMTMHNRHGMWHVCQIHDISFHGGLFVSDFGETILAWLDDLPRPRHMVLSPHETPDALPAGLPALPQELVRIVASYVPRRGCITDEPFEIHTHAEAIRNYFDIPDPAKMVVSDHTLIYPDGARRIDPDLLSYNRSLLSMQCEHRGYKEGFSVARGHLYYTTQNTTITLCPIIHECEIYIRPTYDVVIFGTIDNMGSIVKTLISIRRDNLRVCSDKVFGWETEVL
jgi:hypothetical protein